MSQAERSRSHLSYFTRKKPRPTSNLHPNNKGTPSPHGHSSEPTTPTFGNQDKRSGPKKSVLSKVKEKAKKLSQLLVRQRHPRIKNNPIPPGEATSQKERDEKVPVRHSTPRSDVATDARNSSASEGKSTLQLPVDTSATASVSNPSNKKEPEEKSKNKVLQQPVLDNAGVEHTTIPETIAIPTRLNNPASKEKSMDDIQVRKDLDNAGVEHTTIPETIAIPTRLNNPASKEKSMDDIQVRKDNTSNNSSMGNGNNEVLGPLASDNSAVEYINILETAAIPTSLDNPDINTKSSDDIPICKDNSSSISSSIEKSHNERLQQSELDNAAVEQIITIPNTDRLKDPTITEKSSNQIPGTCGRWTSTEEGNNEFLQQPTLANAVDEHITIPESAMVPTSLNNPCINEKSKVEIPVNKVNKDRSSTEKANNEVFQQATLDNLVFEHLTIQDTVVAPANLNNLAFNERFKDEIPVCKDRSITEKANNEVLQQPTLDNPAVEHLTIQDTAVAPTNRNNPGTSERFKDEILVSKDGSKTDKENNEVLQQILDNAAIEHLTIPDTVVIPTSLNNPAMNEKSSNDIPNSEDRSVENGKSGVLQQPNHVFNYVAIPKTALKSTSLNNLAINEKSFNEVPVIKKRSSSSNMEEGNKAVFQQSVLDTNTVEYTTALETATITTSLTNTINKKSKDERSVRRNRSNMEKGNNEVLQQLALDNVAVGYVNILESAMELTSLNPSTNEKSSDEILVSKASNNISMEKGNSTVLHQLPSDNVPVDYVTITETVPVLTSHNPAINKKSLDEIQTIKDRSSDSNNNNNNNDNKNDSTRYNRSNSCKTLGKTVTDMLSPAYFIVSGATQAITSKIQKSSGPDNNRYNRSNSCKTLGKTVTDMLSPAYTAVSGATQAIASKIQGSSGPVYEIAAKQVWDRSTSVKDYLMHKLEPGEEDKALCNVITAAVNPKCVSPASEEVTTMNKEVVLVKGEIEGSAVAAVPVPAN